MKVGVPKETASGERRVALVPDSTKRLAEAGVTKDDAHEAVATLESEAIRARRIVAARGASAKTARYLYNKGFSEDVVSGAVADGADREIG